MIRSKTAPWWTDKELDELVAELQMDTAELSVKMHYEMVNDRRTLDWKTVGLEQDSVSASLRKFISTTTGNVQNKPKYAIMSPG